MAYYLYRCPVCGMEWEEKRAIEDRDNSPKCCGEQQTERIQTPIAGDIDQPAAGKKQ